jgi:uncharacterized membrane protein
MTPLGYSKADPTPPSAHDMAQATAQLHAEHKQEASALQQALDRLTAFVGWSGFVAALAVAMLLWIAINLTAARMGLRSIDPPPFVWLQSVTSAGALLMTALILSTQRREDQLDNHRDQLNLELSILTDQKISKIIELIEEIRRDNPAIHNRVDDEAEAMSTPADTRAVLDAIKEVQEDLA